jgi:predicted RNA-binding protein YlxR (DUF448 family)/ribosomal protein L30E
VAKADPQRSCLGCRVVKPKDELLRFVLDPERVVLPDVSRKLPGRGAYTCYNRNCLSAAISKRQFSRSFKGEVTLPPSDELISMVTRLQEERIASIISMANKAGKAVSGSDKVMETLRKGTVALLVLAGDISPDSRTKFAAIAEKTGVKVIDFSLKERLGATLGKEIRTAVAVVSLPFAEALDREFTRYRNFFQGGAK